MLKIDQILGKMAHQILAIGTNVNSVLKLNAAHEIHRPGSAYGLEQ